MGSDSEPKSPRTHPSRVYIVIMLSDEVSLLIESAYLLSDHPEQPSIEVRTLANFANELKRTIGLRLGFQRMGISKGKKFLL